MEKYIKRILEQQKRAIIPGFGALTYLDGVMTFNPWLKNDISDNIANAIANGEGIAVEDAKLRISNYVNSLNQSIANNGSASINGIGEFYNESGTIDFRPDNNTESNGSSDDLSSCIVDDEPVASTEPTPENPSEAEPTYTDTVAPTPHYENKERRNWIVALIIAIIFLIGVILCLFVINKDNCVYNFFFGGEEVPQTVAVAPEPKPEPEPEPEAEPNTNRASQFEKRYNIIVATYKSESQAQAKVEALQAKGFDHAFVAVYRGNYVAVIDSHDSLPEAEARQEQIVDNYRIESYITNAGE